LNAWTENPSTLRRVGGYAADAVIICRKIIRREIGTVNNRRVGGGAANPTYSSIHNVAD